jgi:hypothetical protein
MLLLLMIGFYPIIKYKKRRVYIIIPVKLIFNIYLNYLIYDLQKMENNEKINFQSTLILIGNLNAFFLNWLKTENFKMDILIIILS